MIAAENKRQCDEKVPIFHFFFVNTYTRPTLGNKRFFIVIFTALFFIKMKIKKEKL